MPRYHFHSADGHREPDLEGSDLANDQAAQREAMRFAGAVLESEPDSIWQHGTWRVEVTDDNNVLLFTVITIAIDAPRPDFAHFPKVNSST